MDDVVDLCDSDDEEELPPLAARLLQRGAPPPPQARVQTEERNHSPAKAGGPPAAASARAPLLAVQPGHAPGSPAKPCASAGSDGWQPSHGTDLLAGAEALRRRQQARVARKAAAAAAALACAAASEPQHGEPPRLQHHQPQQQQRPPPPPQQQQRQEPGGDGDGGAWRPGGASQPTRSASGAHERPAPVGPDAGRAAPAEKPARKARRTREEIERDKATQVQQREDRKRVKQAGTQRYALQQVRLLVDAALVCGGGAGAGSLGVGMLASLEEHNGRLPAAAAERAVNFVVQPLGLLPYRGLAWQRRRLVEAGGGEAGSQAGSQAGRVEEVWEAAPHVMLCFQPQEFLHELQRDRLAGALAALEARCAGGRPHLLVCGLAHHVATREQREHREAMRGGGAPPGQSVRALAEEFAAELAVRCPRLAYREVVDAAQAAQHVQLVTAAIAAEPFMDDDATVWLRSHDKSGNTALTNHLLNHPLEEPLRPLMKALCALPSVPPSVAHALVLRWRSLAELMDFLLDPATPDAQKERQIADELRVGVAGQRRVGPAAARALLQLLRCDDPEQPVRADGKDAA